MGAGEPGQEAGKSKWETGHWGRWELDSEPEDLTWSFSSAATFSVVKSKCSRV